MTEQAAVFQPDWVSPPGNTIADLLEEMGWSQVEFAQRCGYTTKHVSQLVNAKAAITEDTAIKLERVLGSTARFWMTQRLAVSVIWVTSWQPYCTIVQYGQ